MSARPNILRYCADQQRYDTIRALGQPHIETPNLDALCLSGVAFKRAYSQSQISALAANRPPMPPPTITTLGLDAMTIHSTIFRQRNVHERWAQGNNAATFSRTAPPPRYLANK